MTENANQPAETQPQGDGASSPDAEARAQAVKDIMEFDPFGPASPAEAGSDDTGTKEGDGGEGSGEVVEEPGGEKPPVQTQPDPKAAGTPAQPPMQQGPTQREQELLAQIAALQQAIQQTQPKAQQTDKPQAKFNLGIPPQVIQGLRSEDEQEFAVAMHAVINGVANKVWTEVQDHLAKQVMPSFDQRVQAVVSQGTQVKQVHDEFYGAYPHLKNPMIAPLVQNAALQVGQTWASQGRAIQWNKEFADAVAALVHQVVPMPQQQQQPAPQPKRQTFTARPGSRPAAPAGNEFADIL